MGQPRPWGSVADRLTAAAASALVGRAEERARLRQLLAPDGPAVVFVHGPGGIGKSTLVTGTLTSLAQHFVVLDGRRMEPTASGALAEIGAALGGAQVPSASAAAERIAAAGVEVLVIDSFERLNLLDGWIRNELVGALPGHVTTLLVGRREPNVAWRGAPGWGTVLTEVEVGPLTSGDVDLLLEARGVHGDDAVRIRGFARGHPLAVVAAADASVRRPGLSLDAGAPADVVEDLFAMMLDDLEPDERQVVESVSVLRRVTLPLLAAVTDEPDVEDAWRVLRSVPFTVTTAAGVELSGVAAPVLLEALELRDPARVRALRARAARVILESLTHEPDWESTADLLHLVQNPLIRNAYAPPGLLQHAAEQARPEDRDDILAIARRFCGEESARLTESWWKAGRNAFTVVRSADAGVAAFSVIATVDDGIGAGAEDPVVSAISDHLREDPIPPGTTAVVFRWALGRRHGERPTPEVATLVVDLKRTYLQLRPTLSRVYAAVIDWPREAPVMGVMGFDALSEVTVGARRFMLVCLDFGPGGVDGWIGRHVLAEQGVPVAVPPPAAIERPPLFRLTAREQEVLGLLAEGMTNAQLADALFISERTANRHVSNIFTKLDVHNRTQAARIAMEAGLVG
jgi:DNA-binding CsgD family transcriptional regulator